MSAPRQPRFWKFALSGQSRPLEESCRRVHEFATRYPNLYAWRVRVSAAVAVVAPFYALAFLSLVAVFFPWAFRESELLRSVYEQPLLRWALLGGVYAVFLPLFAIYASGIVRGLTLKLPRPEGMRLRKEDAPRLFRLLEETCRSLDASPVDEIRLSRERTLEVQRRPFDESGALGRPRTVLIAGLPLLEELSPQHLRALVAHEVAHLATHKRRLGGRILGLRERLEEIRQAAEESAVRRNFWGRIPDEMLLEIVNKLQAKLLPETFPAARQHEAEADAIAATIAGRDFAVSALLRERIAGHALGHRFQDECMKQAEALPAPPEDLFEQRSKAASGAFSEGEIHAWLRAELEKKDDLSQSHGPLWDRLRMLGCRLESLTDFQDLLGQMRPQDELGETAARYFLGDTAESMRAEFCREWREHQAADWRKRFEVYERLRATAAGWDAGKTREEATADELWQIAVAIGNTRGWKEALPVATRILAIAPEHADANLLAGQLRLEDGEAAGIESLERAMRSDGRVVPIACGLAARFLEQRGQRDAAGEYHKRIEQYRKAEQAMAQERAHVRATDQFLPADCPAGTAEALRQAVGRNASHIRAAYLLRKQVAAGDPKPLYVLGVERRNLPFENAALANRILLERIMRVPGVPGDVLVCVVTKANRAMLARWKSVPQSLLCPAVGRTMERNSGPVTATKPATNPANLVRETAPAGGALPARSSPATAK